MSDIFSLTSQYKLTGQEASADFILKNKTDQPFFDSKLNFDNDLWDVTGAFTRRGEGNKRERIRFSTLASANTKSPESMHADFKGFATAYI